MKILSISLFVIFSYLSFGQKEFTTYTSELSDTEYSIKLSDDIKRGYTLMIDCRSTDKLYKDGGLMVNEKAHAPFLNALSEAKLKYAEWKQVAIDNNVDELRKPMTIKSKVSSYFLYGSEWKFQFSVDLSFNFFIREGEYILYVSTGELTSSSNQFMKHDGFSLMFTSEDEIDTFINAISVEKIKEELSKPKDEDLFKD